MKNREYYKEELLELAKENKVCEKFIRPKIFGNNHCFNRYCADCRIIFDYWLDDEVEGEE